MNVAETARKALAALDKDGWCKGSTKLDNNARIMFMGTEFILGTMDGKYPDGSHCLGGAWNIALHGIHYFLEDPELYEPLVQAILAQYPEVRDHWIRVGKEPNSGLILHWNDRKETTEADVRAILEKLASDD